MTGKLQNLVTRTITEDADYISSKMAGAIRRLSGTTLLITGAAGFLGSYLLDVLAAFNRRIDASSPCRIIAEDNFATGISARIAHLADNPNFTFVHGDVTKPLKHDMPVDWIIHAAGIASPTFYRRLPLETIAVNVDGTRNALELARQHKVKSMIFMSSSEIYGDPESNAVPTPETYVGRVSCTGPRACYDESKRLGETLCTVYHRLHKVPVKMVRPFNVYGPGQRIDDKRIIPDLMTAALTGKPIVLYSDGNATRSFCYVRDFARGALHVLLCDANGEAFNVGNDEEISIGALAKLMCEIAGNPPLPVEYRASKDTHYLTDNPQRRCPDLRKLHSMVGYRPEVSVKDGLRRTLESYRELT
jgi:UDP-glucuronate decarboxylase